MNTVNLTQVALDICQDRGFTFIERVGEGASKETFHVQLPTRESIALKVLRPNVSMRRVQREIEAMVRCDHPNIGKFHSIEHFTIQQVGFRYILEEFVHGGSLQERLASGSLTRKEVICLGSSLVSAIVHMQAHGLVHRDLAPKNILFRADGITPVVVDFGIVRDLTQSSLTQAWQDRGPGTPFFASPEQLNNQKDLIDWRADQFGLGVVLSVCAFGYHPYAKSGDSPPDIVARVADREEPSPQFQRDCSMHRLAVLSQMVAPWPVNRIRRPHSLQIAWDAQGN